MEEQTSPHGEDNLTFGSLFAGVGGFDLGFEAAGWTPRWQVEWDAKCQSVLAHHWPDVTRYGDVCDVGVVPLAGRSDDGRDGLRPQPDIDGRESPRHLLEPVDCITYGFPCQDLSVAGQRAGLDGDRSNLFFEAVRIIREMREATRGRYPTVAVAENVVGLLSADRGAAMGRCLDALADIGAVGIEWAVLDAQHFGVPQRRARVFIVAWFNAGISRTQSLLPVRDRCDRRIATSAKTEQATASEVDVSLGPRRVTPRECERLMGWPDDHTRWAADGTQIADSNRYKMCGNGVVAPVSGWIANRLSDAIRAAGS